MNAFRMTPHQKTFINAVSTYLDKYFTVEIDCSKCLNSLNMNESQIDDMIRCDNSLLLHLF